MFRLIRHNWFEALYKHKEKIKNEILQPPHLVLLGPCGCGERWTRLARLNFTSVGKEQKNRQRLTEISSGVTLGAAITYKWLVYNRSFQINQTLDFLPLFKHSTKSSDVESVSTLTEALLSEGQCRIVGAHCRGSLTVTKVVFFHEARY